MKFVNKFKFILKIQWKDGNMATVIGFDETKYKKFTCYACGAIVRYALLEDKYTDRTDEGTRIRGLNCPNCLTFHRTNP
jgi:transcription initiation factor IIE alpha subunit